MESYLLLSFKNHKYVCYLAKLMLAWQCSYVHRSHKCQECKSKEGEAKSLGKHAFHVTSDIRNADLKINFLIFGTYGLWKVICFYSLRSMNLFVIWLS